MVLPKHNSRWIQWKLKVLSKMQSRNDWFEWASMGNFFVCKRFFLDTNFLPVIVCNRKCKDAEVKRSQLRLRGFLERISNF